MSLPLIIQVIGMHGVGKTTVIAKAAELFGLKGLSVAMLDVDHFAHAFLAKRVDPALSEKDYCDHLLAIADSIKGKIAHPIGLGDAKTTNALVINAVNDWVAIQDADIILLEMHWPVATSYYRDRDELWLVSALPKSSRAHLEQYEFSRVDGLLRFSQKHWRENFSALPRDKRHVSNIAMDPDAIHDRITRFVECLYHETHQPLAEAS